MQDISDILFYFFPLSWFYCKRAPRKNEKGSVAYRKKKFGSLIEFPVKAQSGTEVNQSNPIFVNGLKKHGVNSVTPLQGTQYSN